MNGFLRILPLLSVILVAGRVHCLAVELASKADYDKLCGINASYVALRLSGKTPDFEQILKSVPDVRKTGMTVQAVQECIESFGVKTFHASASIAEIASFSQVAVVLFGRDSLGFNRPKSSELNHFVVVQGLGNNRFQVIDPPYDSQVFTALKEGGPTYPSIVLLPDGATRPLRVNWLIFGIGGLLLLGGGSFSFLRRFRHGNAIYSKGDLSR